MRTFHAALLLGFGLGGRRDDRGRCAELCATAGPADRRLRRRRSDRHPRAFHRRQAGHDPQATGGGREQAGRGRNARHPRCDLAAGRRPHACCSARISNRSTPRRTAIRSSSSTDLAPISLISKYYYGIAMTNALPVNDLDGFIAHAKANPGAISYATLGRRLRAGDLRAPARASRRHFAQPRAVPHRPADHARPDRGTRAHLRLADAGGAAAA